MITISKAWFSYLVATNILFLGWYLYTCWLFHRAKLDKTTAKKWKLISKWEFRDTIRQEHLAIKEFIERYTEKHKIDWSEYI